LEVYADPLVSKVYHNLIDNAVRHGGNVTTIHFFFESTDGTYAIICQDDGIGITPDVRGGLFMHSSGKGHGFGLFLSREILAITGITIKEEGEPGRGARFVLTMPSGGVRGQKKDGP
jgi:signal transduction histidine kinase